MRNGRSRQQPFPARRRSDPQTRPEAAGARRGGPLSLRSVPGVWRVRSLPEARCWRAGLAPHCGSGCGPGWARRGRVGYASSHSHPRSFPPPNARCHLFAACHVFTVPCQAGWPGFRGQGGRRRSTLKSLHFAVARLSTGGFTCDLPGGLLLCLWANAIRVASLCFCLLFYKGV